MMGFNKRFIDLKSLEKASNMGLDYLIKYVKNPDALIIKDNASQKICDVITNIKDKSEIKEKLNILGLNIK